MRTSISGPEPGYIATALMFSVMARTVVDDRSNLGVTGGVFTPGGLVGSGGAAAVLKLVERLRSVGIAFEVEERKALVPRPVRDETKRPVWQTALNALACLGWCCVLALMLQNWSAPSLVSDMLFYRGVLALECICVFEVLQIALGTAKGNIALGIGIHYTRLLELLLIMPSVPNSLATKLGLLAWSATEVCRYPMFLFPNAAPARIVRYVAPIATFPLGAGAEAMAAYLALEHLHNTSGFLRTLVRVVIPANILVGVFFYRSLVARGIASFRGTSRKTE